LLTDAGLRRRLGAQAREYMLSEFSVERLAHKTGEVYREALRGERGAQDEAC